MASQWVYTQHYYGLGASGMVMGALGLLAIIPPENGWNRQAGLGIVLRGIGATFLTLVLIGFSPESDVVAHVGGYLCGVVFGLALSRVPLKVLQEGILNLVTGVILMLIMVVTWWLALR